MGALINRIKDWWQSADRTQKLVSVFGSLFLVAILAFTAYFAGKPKMVPIYSGLSPADQGMVVDELRKHAIPVEIGPQGAIMVPSNKADEAPMILATANKMPNPGPKGNEWLEGLSPFGTQGQEREKIKAAKEGEMSRSIMTMDGVQSALVHISFGSDSPFAEESVAPTAVVNIKESAGGGLRPEQGKAIARLVQNAVPGLRADKVSVINTAGRLVYDGEEQSSTEGLASKKLETEIAESKRRESDLQRRLDVAFGPGNTVAMIQLELNMDAVNQTKTETELGDKKVTGEATEELADGNANAVSGITGIDANNPSAPATTTPGNGKVNYKSTQKSIDYPSTETHTSTTKAAGDLVSMTVNVIANSSKIKDPSSIQAIVDDYLGAKKGQPGFSAAVQSVQFDTSVQETEKKAAQTAASQAQMQQMISMLPVGALLLVGFMVAKAIGKIPGKTLTMALPTGGHMNVDFDQSDPAYAVQGSGALPNRALTSIQALAQTEPELAEALSAMGIESIDESVDVEAIRQKIDLPLEQIRKMAKQKPQAVAMLMKSWLLEERR